MTGSQISTDLFPIHFHFLLQLITEKGGVDPSAIGANPSAEEGAGDDVAESSKSGCNIVLAHNLEELHLTKKDYMKRFKAYVARIVEHLKSTKPDYVEEFKANVQAGLKVVLEMFNEWQFFAVEGNEATAKGPFMIALLGFREDQITPYMLFLKDGLLEEKTV